MHLKQFFFGNECDIKRFPVLLIILVGILICFSFVSISSASMRPLYDGEWINAGYHIKQMMFLVLSLIIFFLVIRMNYIKIAKWTIFLYFGGLLLLLMVFLIGTTVNGAKRWIDIKLMRFQPSELMKLIIIIILAEQLKFNKHITTLKGLLKPLIIVSIPCLIILRQPDLGTSMVFVPVTLAMLMVAGAKKRYIIGFVLLIIILAPLVYFFVLKDYQQARIIAFIEPEKHSQTDGYHLIQSKTAVGNGMLTGTGYRQGSQNVLGYLPENHTDFIFSVVCEEWGFLGGLGVIILYFLIISQIFAIAAETREPFGRFICVGVGVLFAFHVFENISMTIGLMPITGLTLPFFSYGGSSLFTCFIALGLIVNIRMRQSSLCN